jgi:hypothetical protein
MTIWEDFSMSLTTRGEKLFEKHKQQKIFK